MILCGERRWTAARLAGLKTVPCIYTARAQKSSPPARPTGSVRDLLHSTLVARGDEAINFRTQAREMDFVCCACGMGENKQAQATMCAACPLAAFLNRFACVFGRREVSGLVSKTSPRDYGEGESGVCA